MNLHGIASGYIAAVNPPEIVSLQISIGATTAADGTQVATFAPSVNVSAQIQALAYGDLQQIDALNIQGIRRKVYIAGRIDGLVRVANKGGDLITFSDGTIWKVVLITEYWPDWTSAIITMQDETVPMTTIINANTTISAPGYYEVHTPGVTIGYLPPATWVQQGSVTIKDMTGSSAPSINLIGSYDGASGLALSIPGEAVVLTWSAASSTMLVSG
jgi:hypothetical protein